MPRIILLVTSPRLPPGLLTDAAWDLLRAHPVLAAAESAGTEAIRATGVPVRMPDGPWEEELLAAAGSHGTVVWLAGPGGDPDLARRLGMRLAREPGLAELELAYGSWDPPGARLLDAVTVIDRLLAPGGDPWLRDLVAGPQPHRSLARYLREECYEALDAIDAGDLAALREELGDLLFQVVLHAQLAAEWSVDDVAAGLVEKLVRRNPHVFAGATVADLDEITANWERIKQAEKPRGSPLDRVVRGQPALSLAAAILSQAERAGLAAPVAGAASVDATDPDALGQALLAIVAAATAAGVDAEAALRRAALAHADQARVAERD